MKATKLFAATALSLALAAPASAQMVLQSWDVDGDGELTGAEFRGLFNDNPMLASIDANGDGDLSKDEYDAFFGENVTLADTSFGTYGFDSWDLDSDGLVQDAEFEQGFLTIYDEDGNGTIDESEFTTLQGEMEM